MRPQQPPLPLQSKGKLTALLLALVAAVVLGSSGIARAQGERGAAGAQRLLSDAEVQARYRNCPRGYYSGPQPGKARFTQDRFVWAVTPAFAAAFCLPKEFISPELKGAEAIAYRMVEDLNEESCGWGGRPEVCRRPRVHRFDVYYPNGLLAKLREVPYFHAANLASKMLISSTQREMSAKSISLRDKPRVGALGPFESGKFAVLSFGAKGQLPLGTVTQEIYYEEVFQGIDYVALEMDTGFSHASNWKTEGTKDIAIATFKPGKKVAGWQVPRSDYETEMRLPARMVEALIRNDSLPVNSERRLFEEAMGTSPTSNK